MIQVALHKGTTWVSQLIRWHTSSVYSHAELWFPNYVVSAESSGVENLTLPVTKSGGPGTVVDLFVADPPLTPDQERRLEQSANKLVGAPYDYRQVFLGFPLRYNRESLGSRDRWFCSEVVAKVFEDAGRPLLSRTHAWRVPPAWLAMSPVLRWRETVVIGRRNT